MNAVTPSGWVETTLGEAFRWSSGGTPLRSVTAYYGGEIPWAVIGDLEDGLLDSTASTITESGLANSSARWASPGAVLIAMYGSIGKLGIARQRLTTNQAIAFTDPAPIESKFLFYYLLHSRSDLIDRGKGGTQQNISQTVLKAFPFRLAPLAEQRRIVAAIEEHLSRVDAGVEALERVKKALARYRASVLKAASEGRLVPTEAVLARAEGRFYEPASELLARILAERHARWDRKKKYAEPAPPDTSSLPDLPEGWVCATLSALADLKGGITKGQKRKPGERVREVPYLRVANVQRGWLDLAEIKTIEATEAEIEDLRLQAGDVLFNEGGDRDKLGRGWIWGGQIPACIHQNHVFRARLLGTVDPKFVSWHGNTFGKAWFEEHGKQTTNLASINLTKLGMLPVPLPPLAEQHRIAAEVERRLSIADEVAASVDSALARAARLRQSILKRAFEGRLVPQDPNDEPASILLQRLRADRAVQEVGKCRTRTRRVTGSDARRGDGRRRAKSR